MVSNTVTDIIEEYGEITTTVNAWLEDETGSSAVLCVQAIVSGGNEAATYGAVATLGYNGNGSSEEISAGEGVLIGEDKVIDSTYKWTVNKTHDGWTATCKVTSSYYMTNEEETLPEEMQEANEVTCEIAIPATSSYIVSYNANGGEITPESQTKWHDESLTLSADKLTKIGHTLIGWSSYEAATEAEYALGASYTNNESVTLYAVWKINTYTVAYNANDGVDAPENQTKIYNETLTLSADEPTRENYVFIGWGTSANDTTVDYKPNDDYTKNASVTLYAIWAKTYNVRYDANGGENAPDSQIKVGGFTLSLSGNVPVKKNNMFVGWSDSIDGGAKYYPDFDYVDDMDVTLYAVWEPTDNIVKKLFDDDIYDASSRSRLNGVPTSGSGSKYEVEVVGINHLNVGTTLTIIPHTTGAIAAPTLNLNGLGEKIMVCHLSEPIIDASQEVDESWIIAGKPLIVTYDGVKWIANDVPNVVSIENGGTGADNRVEALHNLGIHWGEDDAEDYWKTLYPNEEERMDMRKNTIYIQIN